MGTKLGNKEVEGEKEEKELYLIIERLENRVGSMCIFQNILNAAKNKIG